MVKVSIIIPTRHSEIEFITAESNKPGEARNKAARAASGGILAFIDDDAYPSKYWLLEAKKIFSEDDKIGIVCGPGVTPSWDGFFKQASGKVYEILGGERYKPTNRHESKDVPSCNLLIRKDVFDLVGGFPEEFFPGEDTILCQKVIDAGYKIIYDPKVLVYHHRRNPIGHLKQIARYARMRGTFKRLYPETGRFIGYILPSVVVILLFITILVYGINFLWGLIKRG